MKPGYRLPRALATVVTLLLPCQLAFASDPANLLEHFFNDLKTLQADFRQQIVNDAGKVLQVASGKLFIQRPGRFRWDYEEPYRQLVLADGKKLWNYDPDLEQAVVREIGSVLSSTPAMLLSGDQPVADVFLVTRLAAENDIEWLELVPKAKETDFQRIRLGFSNGVLSRMEMRDFFGQNTLFEFSHVRRNQQLATGLFTFTPPPGVDVMGDL